MEHNSKYNKNYLPPLFLILLLIFLLSLRFLKELGFFGDKDLKEALLWAQQDSIRVADSLKRVDMITKDTVEKQSESVIEYDEEKIPGESMPNKYYIIIGSFINPENAKLASKEYRGKEYNTNFIKKTNQNGIKSELVSVKTFNNFDEAVNYLREFQRLVDSKAWIYTNQ